MAEISGKTATLSLMSQEIDLKKYLGRKPTDTEKTAFAELAIDFIENRTLDGKEIDGTTDFTEYTQEYADAKGVTRDSVDLFLRGNMLESIGRRTSKERVNTVFIQMKKGLQTKKAFRHDTGDDGMTKREFFGITDAQARRIAEEIKEEQEQRSGLSLAELRAALNLLDIEQTE